MKHKHCSRCDTDKPLTEFRIMSQKTGRIDPYCIPCRRTYNTNLTQRPDQKVRRYKSNVGQKKRNFDVVYQYLQTHPCEHCGETDFRCLDFDHIDQSTKQYSISAMLGHSLELLQTEMAKCRILCANCHRKHTAVQLGFYKNYLG